MNPCIHEQRRAARFRYYQHFIRTHPNRHFYYTDASVSSLGSAIVVLSGSYAILHREVLSITDAALAELHAIVAACRYLPRYLPIILTDFMAAPYYAGNFLPLWHTFSKVVRTHKLKSGGYLATRDCRGTNGLTGSPVTLFAGLPTSPGHFSPALSTRPLRVSAFTTLSRAHGVLIRQAQTLLSPTRIHLLRAFAEEPPPRCHRCGGHPNGSHILWSCPPPHPSPQSPPTYPLRLLG